MGITIAYDVTKHGMFPNIVGNVAVRVQKQSGTIRPIDLGVNRGNDGEKKVHIKVFVSEGQQEFYGNLIEHIETELKPSGIDFEEIPKIVVKGRKGLPSKTFLHLNIQARVFIERADGGGSLATALCADTIIEKPEGVKIDKEDYTKVQAFIDEVRTYLLAPNVFVTERTADQLFLYCALAEGQSKLAVTRLSPKNRSQHLETIIDVVRMFLPDVAVTKTDLSEDSFELEITGIGLQNQLD